MRISQTSQKRKKGTKKVRYLKILQERSREDGLECSEQRGTVAHREPLDGGVQRPASRFFLLYISSYVVYHRYGWECAYWANYGTNLLTHPWYQARRVLKRRGTQLAIRGGVFLSQLRGIIKSKLRIMQSALCRPNRKALKRQPLALDS